MMLLIGPLAGSMAIPGLKDMLEKCTVIAVDGGIKWARSKKIVPQFLVGDFDSAQKKDVDWAYDHGTHLFELHPQKDLSDFAFALMLAQSFKPKVIVCVGFLGGRIDHEHAVLLETAFNAKQTLIHTQADERSPEYLTYVQPKSVVTFQPKKNEVFSVFAPTGKVSGLTIAGSKFDVKNITLTASSFGLSNEGLSRQVTLSHKKGTLLLISRNVPKLS